MRVATVAALTIAALATSACAGSAGFHEDYLHEARIELGAYPDVGNQVVIGYRRYFGEIVDGERPYRLQPFVQKATYAEGALEFGPGRAGLFGFGGRYMFPDTPFGALADFGFGKTDQNDNRSFANLGFDFYVTDRFPQFVIEARAEFGNTAVEYNRLQAGVRALMTMRNTGHTLELYAGYGSLSTRGPGVVMEARYFFDKHLFAGLEFATDTDSFGLSGGYSTEKGFFAEMEFGTVREGPEGWGNFLRISMGLQF